MEARSASKTGMVISGRAARPCDVCGKERARWYCAADEAYLCERCDESVHSANTVARRHERVKLGPNGAPLKIERKRNDRSIYRKDESMGRFAGSKRWQHGSKKRSQIASSSPKPPVADTSIHPRPANAIANSLLDDELCTLVPKAESCTHSSHPEAHFLLPATHPSGCLATPPHPSAAATQLGECDGLKKEPGSPLEGNISSGNTAQADLLVPKTEDDELAHDVPIFDPLFEELISEDLMEGILAPASVTYEERSLTEPEAECKEGRFMESGFIQCEIESGMGGAVEEGSISIEDISIIGLCASSSLENETDDLDLSDIETWRLDSSDDTTELETYTIGTNPFKGKGERQLESENVKLEQDTDPIEALNLLSKEPMKEMKAGVIRKTISLRLDYEDVLSAWSDRGSFWTDGRRPQTVPDDSIIDIASLEVGIVPDLSCTSSQAGEQEAGQVPVIEQSSVDAAREARVMRYREKRRTRLFSKKIRYEVRKLNAERRPRMKGRFVKRSPPGL